MWAGFVDCEGRGMGEDRVKICGGKEELERQEVRVGRRRGREGTRLLDDAVARREPACWDIYSGLGRMVWSGFMQEPAGRFLVNGSCRDVHVMMHVNEILFYSRWG